MISELYIDNFKLYNDQTISLSPLTILTGMNGMGKSSLIQSLLLLRQSQSSNSNLKKGLNLVGDLYRPGQSIDVKSQSNPNASMQIKLTFDHNQAPLDFRFTYTGNEDSIILGDENNVSDDDILKQYSLFNKSFQYISAFRLGPQINDYDKDDSIVKELGQISKMYGMCEYAMHFLLHNGTKQIGVSNLAIKSEGEDENLKLNEQVDRWMHRITRNVFVDVNSPNEKVRLRYKFMGEGAQTLKDIRPINTGYGVSYVLPIVIAILAAPKGALILIENPEAHIHPRGQAELMNLITLAAENGIQVIIETHSDHIINHSLARIAQKEFSLNNLCIYYFERNDADHSAAVIPLQIDEDGLIEDAPEGFFDQIDIDMKHLSGF